MLFLYGVFMTFRYGNYYDVVLRGYDSIMVYSMSCSVFIILFYSNYKFNFLNKILYLIGQNTLGVYVMHVIFVDLFSAKFNKSIFINILPANIIYVLLILIVSLIASVVIKKFKNYVFA